MHLEYLQHLIVCCLKNRVTYVSWVWLLLPLLLQQFYGSLDFVRDKPSELVPEETFTHSHLLWSSISPYLLPQSITIHGILPDSLFAQSLQVFFGLPLGLAPSTSYPIHYFTQSVSSFCSTCPHYCSLFCCSTEIMLSNPGLSLNPLLGTLSCSLMRHIRLTILISARWSATLFSFLMGQVSLPCNIPLHTQLLYNLPFTINDISLFVSSGTNCLNLFHPIWILVSTAASASSATLIVSPK